MLYLGSPRHKEFITKHANEIVGKVQQEKKSVTNFIYLKEINDSLLHENEKLRLQLLQETTGLPIKDSIGNVTFKKDSVHKTLRYHYFASKVLDQTFDEPNNFITLDKGAYQGIKKGMAVISSTGIVGQIVDVSAHYAVAKTLISQRFRVSAQLKSGTLGYISWPELDSRFAQLNNISPSENVHQGDSVFTSNSSMFPANILIGRIIGMKQSSDANNYTILLSTNFKRLHYVYIIEDISGEEINALQESASELDNPKKPKSH